MMIASRILPGRGVGVSVRVAVGVALCPAAGVGVQVPGAVGVMVGI